MEGQIVLLTGAGGGIGRAICRRLVLAGATVIATDIDLEAVESLRDEVDCGPRLVARRLDIVNHDQTDEVVQEAVSRFGRIDALINNAGWDVAKPFLETDPDLWEKIIAINLKGPLNLHHCVLPHMMRAGQGKVVNVASDAGRVGSSGEAVYSACKGGVIAFTKTMARECAGKNVLVNAVCPGPTDTPLLRSFLGEGEYGQKLHEGLKRAIPLRRIGQPEDVAGLIVFLVSPDANFITGQVMSVSGGLTMHG